MVPQIWKPSRRCKIMTCTRHGLQIGLQIGHVICAQTCGSSLTPVLFPTEAFPENCCNTHESPVPHKGGPGHMLRSL